VKEKPTYLGPERRRRRRSHRFMERYEQRRAERARGEHNLLIRPFRIGAGVFLLVLAPFVGAIPGPGGLLVFLAGAFLLASEVRRAAIIMDRIENETIPRLRRLHARIRGGPKAEWVLQDPLLWADWCQKTGKELHEDPLEREDSRATHHPDRTDAVDPMV
jgi:hypothetical protein